MIGTPHAFSGLTGATVTGTLCSSADAPTGTLVYTPPIGRRACVSALYFRNVFGGTPPTNITEVIITDGPANGHRGYYGTYSVPAIDTPDNRKDWLVVSFDIPWLVKQAIYILTDRIDSVYCVPIFQDLQ